MIWSPSTGGTRRVDREAPVGVAVVSDAEVGALGDHDASHSRSRWVEP